MRIKVLKCLTWFAVEPLEYWVNADPAEQVDLHIFFTFWYFLNFSYLIYLSFTHFFKIWAFHMSINEYLDLSQTACMKHCNICEADNCKMEAGGNL